MQTAFLNLLRKSDPSLLEKGALAGLAVLSWGMAAAVRLRGWLYRRGWLRPRRLARPVISIGNVTLGGSGKTPVAEMLARELAARGKRGAILTRGYKGAAGRGREPRRVAIEAGRTWREQARIWGDEPLMLARQLPETPVVVGKNRACGGAIAIERFGAEALILDDGFQHLKLARDLDLVVVDGQAGFGNGKIFPRGLLRENPAGLRRAAAILVKREGGNIPAALGEQIRRFAPDVPVYGWEAAPEHWERLGDGKKEPPAFFGGKPVACVSGIARPESFERGCEKLGARVVARRHFPDHHYFSQEEIAEAFEEAARKGAVALVTTEKDAMRWPAGAAGEPLPVYFLRIAARAPEFLKSEILSHILR